VCRGVMTIYDKAFTNALFLTLGNFATFLSLSGMKQRWMSMGVYTPAGGVPYYIYKVRQRCDIHTGVGFCVARSTVMGNAKASKCGTGDSMNPTLFSYMC
jgi:hypothetical protein